MILAGAEHRSYTTGLDMLAADGLLLAKGVLVLTSVSEEYVCPPCGCDNDDKVFDEPGYCPLCDMQLFLKDGAAAQPVPQASPPNRKKVAIRSLTAFKSLTTQVLTKSSAKPEWKSSRSRSSRR